MRTRGLRGTGGTFSQFYALYAQPSPYIPCVFSWFDHTEYIHLRAPDYDKRPGFRFLPLAGGGSHQLCPQEKSLFRPPAFLDPDTAPAVLLPAIAHCQVHIHGVSVDKGSRLLLFFFQQDLKLRRQMTLLADYVLHRLFLSALSEILHTAGQKDREIAAMKAVYNTLILAERQHLHRVCNQIELTENKERNDK